MKYENKEREWVFMINNSTKSMLGEVSATPLAVVDTVRFSSRNNPQTEINLRTMRGTRLKEHILDDEELGENVDLPTIIGGTNASGKTSLLRGINLLCELLQLDVIATSDTKKCSKELEAMGITTLELDYVIELGSSGNRYSRFTKNTDFVRIRTLTTNDGMEVSDKGSEDIDGAELVLENLFKLRFNSSSDQTIDWSDGLRLRRVAHSEKLDSLETEFSTIEETTEGRHGFRNIKSRAFIEEFLESNKGNNIFGMKIEDFEVPKKHRQFENKVSFQTATLVEIDRSGTEETIEHLRKLVPKITKKFQTWRKKPDTLRNALLDMKKDGKLLKALGLKPSDIFYSEPSAPEFVMLQRFAPEIIEALMMKPRDVNTYTWFSEFAWPSTQRGIDVISEGCIHDIMSFVTGQQNCGRMLVGHKTSARNRYGDTYEVSWTDIDDSEYADGSVDSKFTWPTKDWVDQHKGTHSTAMDRPPLSTILRELPFLSELLGLEKVNTDLLNILVKFNAFTPIEKIEQPYLSSGQSQILALITAVNGAPEGSLVLLDEPEISLHVDWQERLVEQLHMDSPGSRLMIATHSPDIAVHHRHLCTILKASDEGGFYRKEK